MAEGYAQRSVIAGLRYSIQEGYTTVSRVVAEAIVYGAVVYQAGSTGAAIGDELQEQVVFAPRLTEDELLHLARVYAEDQGWPWAEPLYVHRGWFHTHITTNSHMKGGNVTVHLNSRTGAVIHAGYARR